MKMNKFWLLSAFLVFVLVLAGCGNGDGDTADDGAEEDATEEDATEDSEASTSDFDAEEFARTNCTACHGSDFTGSMGPDLTGFDEDALKTAVREGPGAMPSYSEEQISDDELDVLATFFSEL